jgi:hypothetical protein
MSTLCIEDVDYNFLTGSSLSSLDSYLVLLFYLLFDFFEYFMLDLKRDVHVLFFLHC